MVSVNDSPCANCGIPATLRCTGYKDAPDYEPGDVKAVFYCTAACQKEHRPQHKTYCKTMTTRKKLLRIAAICKAAVLGYRAVEFDVELSGIELKGNTLLLYDNQKDFTIAPKCGLFPEHVTSNPEHRDAALSWLFCHASLALLSSLLPKLLEGEGVQVKSSRQPGRVPLPIAASSPVPTPPTPSLDSALGGHGVLKISLLSSSTEEAWVLDVTSAQYGFQNPLEPCMRYIADRGCIDLRLNAYNFTVTSDLDVALSRLCTNELQMRMCRAELPARRRFAAFVNGGPDKSILDGSAALFEERLKKFKLALKLNMCI